MKQIDQTQINDVAWRACDTFRGVLDPSDYKNYIFGLLFLKRLSDVFDEEAEKLLKTKIPVPQSIYSIPLLHRLQRVEKML